MTNASDVLEQDVEKIIKNIKNQLESRGTRAANELRNASQIVLAGQRHGRRYRKPPGKSTYIASAAGEPPAARTGDFRRRWQRRCYLEDKGDNAIIHSIIENNIRVNGHLLGDILEDGTSKMAPRPHHERIIQKAEDKVKRIYKEPYM